MKSVTCSEIFRASIIVFVFVIGIAGCTGSDSATTPALPSGVVFSQTAKLLASDGQTIDLFGVSVRISGDYIIIGAPSEDGGEGDPLEDAGVTYVFHWTGPEPDDWEEEKIISSELQAGDGFGESVAISGDYAVVGADNEAGGGGDPATDAGSAYVFHRTGTNTWDAGVKLVATGGPTAGDFFGNSVAIDGDYIVVGADKGNGGTGAAYVFHRTGTNTWDAGYELLAADRQSGDLFGTSVAISGDYVAVGAPDEDGGPGSPLLQAGAVYVFRRTGTNTWDTGTKVIPSDLASPDQFGASVDISGDYLIAGAPNKNSSRGTAYVFRRTGTNEWDEGFKLTALDGQSFDDFGTSVAISGMTAIVGALNENGGSGDPLESTGAAYIFSRVDTNTWVRGSKLETDDAAIGDSLGTSVAIDGDRAVAGAYGKNSLRGAAYVFEKDAEPPGEETAR